MLILKNTEGGFKTDYPINVMPVEEGVLFDDGIMRVTAFPNSHLACLNSPKCLSFSYLIECEGKRLVYSGDVGKYEDLDAVFEECDGLIIETGHFGINTAYEYWKTKKIDRLFFSHNGREILNYPEESQEKVKKYFGDKAIICEDGMSVTL